jgi:hypothetical protein
MPRRPHDDNLRLVARRRWQFWRRPPESPAIDTEDGQYRRLEEADSDRLARRFAERWLAATCISDRRRADVLASTRLDVADDEYGTSTLRLSFEYLGSQSFLHRWTGDASAAEAFIDQQAEEYAAEIEWERNEFGATDWDDE